MDDISFSQIGNIFSQYSHVNVEEQEGDVYGGNGSLTDASGSRYSPSDDAFFMTMVHAQWIHVPPIILTNVLVIVATYFVNNLHSADNLIIGGLAIMDLMTGVVSIPMLWMFYQIDSTAEQLGGSRVSCIVSLLMPAIFSKTSLSILILMTFDRFVAIRYPFLYSKYSSESYVILTISILFFLTILKMSFAVSLPDKNSTWRELTDIHPNQTFSYEEIRKYNRWSQCTFESRFPSAYRRKVEPVFVWGQLLIGFVMTLHVAWVAWRQHQAIIIVMELYNSEDLKKNKDQIKVTLSLMFMYFVLWLPTSSIEIIHNVGVSDKTLARTYIIAKHFQFINAWVNAIVYAILKSNNATAYHFLISNWPWNWGNINLRRKSRLVCKQVQTQQERMGLKRMALKNVNFEVPIFMPSAGKTVPDLSNFV